MANKGRPAKYTDSAIMGAMDAYIDECCDGKGNRFKIAEFLRYANTVCGMQIPRSTLYGNTVIAHYMDEIKQIRKTTVKTREFIALDIPEIVALSGTALAQQLQRIDLERKDLLVEHNTLLMENEKLKEQNRLLLSKEKQTDEDTVKVLREKLEKLSRENKIYKEQMKRFLGEAYKYLENEVCEIPDKEALNKEVISATQSISELITVETLFDF